MGVATTAADNALLPAPIASVIVDELIRNSPSPIASFGFRATDFTAELANRIGEQRARGAGVALVQPKSAAEKAGLRAGDIVIAVDGSPVSSASELSRALDAVTNSATLTVARGDQQLTMTVSRSIRQQP
jgi:S1-C subfamily serine protease